jgi:hypothetical protein
MKRIIILAAALLLLAAPGHLQAQSESQGTAAAPPQHFYHLKLVVEELSASGSVTNSRTYQTTVSTSGGSDQYVNTGSKIPIATGTSSGPSALQNTQFQYIDLGIEFHIGHVKEIGQSLSFQLKAEISSMAKYSEIAGVNEPVIRQNTWLSDILVPAGKPTVVYSSDDLDTKGKTQVEVTATPVE